MNDRKFRIIGDHILGRTEKNTLVGFFKHINIVIRITKSDYFVIQAFESDNGFTFGISLPQVVAIDNTITVHFKGMTEKGGPVELIHERLGKLDKSIRDNNKTGDALKPVDHVECAMKRLNSGNYTLNIQ